MPEPSSARSGAGTAATPRRLSRSECSVSSQGIPKAIPGAAPTLRFFPSPPTSAKELLGGNVGRGKNLFWWVNPRGGIWRILRIINGHRTTNGLGLGDLKAHLIVTPLPWAGMPPTRPGPTWMSRSFSGSTGSINPSDSEGFPNGSSGLGWGWFGLGGTSKLFLLQPLSPWQGYI